QVAERPLDRLADVLHLRHGSLLGSRLRFSIASVVPPDRGQVSSPDRSSRTYAGGCGAVAASVRVEMPVSTRAASHPALAAPSMSVSSRSPTTSGRPPPARSSAASRIGGFGLPKTSAYTPVAASRAARI